MTTDLNTRRIIITDNIHDGAFAGTTTAIHIPTNAWPFPTPKPTPALIRAWLRDQLPQDANALDTGDLGNITAVIAKARQGNPGTPLDLEALRVVSMLRRISTSNTPRVRAWRERYRVQPHTGRPSDPPPRPQPPAPPTPPGPPNP